MREPTAATLAPADDCVAADSSGVVSKPESYNYRTHLPERDGLYSVEVFGPVDWAASDAAPFPFLGDMRSEHWGHIALATPIQHPDAPAVLLSSVPVMPPAYRRFTMQSAAEAHARSRTFRDRVIDDPDEAHADPPSVLLGEQGLWNFEEGRPLTDEEIDAMGSTAIEPPVSGLYRRVVNRSNRVERLTELEAPAPVLEAEQASLVADVAALFAHIHAMELPPSVVARATAACAHAR